MDADSYQVVGNIPNIEGVHGIAIAGEFGRGFITDDEANRVTIFDLKTLKKIGNAKTIKVRMPSSMIPPQSASSPSVDTTSTATALDAATGSVVGTVDLGGSPEFAAADRQGHIYNNLEDKNEVVEIDSKTLKILNRWPLLQVKAHLLWQLTSGTGGSSLDATIR